MKLIVGCGYLGIRVARAWVAEGCEVSAITRSSVRAKALERERITPIVADVTQPETLELPAAQTVLIAVGYDRRSRSASLFETYVGGLQNVLNSLPTAERLIYISSTGVYGQTDGSWVDEDSICEPTREGGKACLEAERVLAASNWARRSVTLRLAGIYGPGRVPAREEARARLDLNLSGYLNLIHVDDAMRAVLAAEQYPHPPATFLIADGHPVDRTQYYREVVRRFPRSSERALAESASTLGRQRLLGSKRVSNRRMMETLGLQPTFPSYREGLAAIAAGC